MGAKVHVAEVYQVKHNISDNFSGKQFEINSLLFRECEGVSSDEEDVTLASQIEVPRTELAKLIGKIARNRDKYGRWCMKNGITESLDEIITIIAKWISCSDQRNDFVVLSWF